MGLVLATVFVACCALLIVFGGWAQFGAAALGWALGALIVLGADRLR